MKYTVHSTNVENQEVADFIVELPSVCPHCANLANSKILSGNHIFCYETDKETTFLIAKIYISVFCGNCEKSFIAEYHTHAYNGNSCSNALKCIDTFPASHTKPVHFSKIEDVSPRFVSIYNQSLFAEESGLDEICGMGYRKALEFLVKDFAIKMHPESREDIEKKLLAKCISDYIDNSKIKLLAKASAWIGNDQTHYIIKNDDYGVKELKSFISAMETFISSELEVIEAETLLTSEV